MELLEHTPPTDVAPLSEDERVDLRCCEGTIERNLKAFMLAAEALAKINRFRYYRETHATFGDYCADRWKMSRQRAYELIKAAEVKESLSAMTDSSGNPFPDLINARQIRAIAGVEDAQRAAVLEKSISTAPDGKLTARHIEETAAAMRRPLASEEDSQDAPPQAVLAISPVQVEQDAPQVPMALLLALLAVKTPRATNPILTSKSNERYTRERYVEAARSVLGTIDLDPASCEQANKTVKATRYFDEAHDGLYEVWEGNVWLNPPYGTDDAGASNAGRWATRLIEQYREGVTRAAILCVNSLTFAPWFKQLWEFPICFTDHRVCYDSPNPDEKQRPMNGTAFVYLGPEPEKFARVFREFGAIVARWPTLEEE